MPAKWLGYSAAGVCFEIAIDHGCELERRAGARLVSHSAEGAQGREFREAAMKRVTYAAVPGTLADGNRCISRRAKEMCDDLSGPRQPPSFRRLHRAGRRGNRFDPDHPRHCFPRPPRIADARMAAKV